MFKMHVLEWKFTHITLNFIQVCCQGPNLNEGIIGTAITPIMTQLIEIYIVQLYKHIALPLVYSLHIACSDMVVLFYCFS